MHIVLSCREYCFYDFRKSGVTTPLFHLNYFQKYLKTKKKIFWKSVDFVRVLGNFLFLLITFF